jgi:transposase
MAGKILNMSKLKQIIRLREQGTGIQTISKGLGISRNTIKKYLALIKKSGHDVQALLEKDELELEALLAPPSPNEEARMLGLEAMRPYIEKELPRTGVSRWLLWKEYMQQNPGGYSYSHFCNHIRRWKAGKDATMHLEHSPGDKMFIDFAGKKLHWVDRGTGELHEVEVYVAVLGHSQMTFVKAVPSQRKTDFLDATQDALHYFGGVPRLLVPDNLKAAVQRADKYEADLNTDFADMANHYGTAVLPARAYRPRDKALVENAVRIAYSRIYAPLRDRTFHSLQELNLAISQLLEQHNDMHFQKEAISRRERFQKGEKEKLGPLPVSRYELKRFRYCTVMKNAHVSLLEDKHYYSVPYRFIAKKVKLVYSSTQVSVYYKGERIAFHRRDMRCHVYTTIKEHMPSAHRFVAEWNPQKFLSWAEGIHPDVKDFITAVMERKRHPEQAYRSCVGILSFDKKVGRERFLAAIRRASDFGAYDYRTVDRILKSGLDRLANEDNGQQMELPFHKNIRGSKDYR